MKLRFNLAFFPALHRTVNHIDLVQLRYRNELRLARAKASGRNIFRGTLEIKDEREQRTP